jgi:uncharacterized protein
MAKTPVMGLVKTRLGRQIGAAAATRFYRSTAQAVLGRCVRDPRFETILALAPDAGFATRAFDQRIKRMRQGRGDLGAKLQRIAERAPPGPVVIVGTDIPSIRPRDIIAAFKALRSHDVVFGPAEDGGFWLVGFKRFPTVPHCYAGVRWSHADTLADVRGNLLGRRVAIVGMLSDVDNADDLRRLGAHIGRRIIGA